MVDHGPGSLIFRLASPFKLYHQMTCFNSCSPSWTRKLSPILGRRSGESPPKTSPHRKLRGSCWWLVVMIVSHILMLLNNNPLVRGAPKARAPRPSVILRENAVEDRSRYDAMLREYESWAKLNSGQIPRAGFGTTCGSGTPRLSSMVMG